jgi:hypothetical protein
MNQFKDYRQFLLYIENNFDEEDQLIIEGFISYYINRFRGFEKRNCECTYKDNLKCDNTGELHNLALIGFNLEKTLKYNPHVN